MSTPSTFDTASVAGAGSHLGADGGRAINDATGRAAALGDSQTGAKWGVEDGATAFRNAYSTYLSQVEESLRVMRAQLESFTESIRSTARAVELNETDIEDATTRIAAQIDGQDEAGRRTYASPTAGPRSDAAASAGVGAADTSFAQAPTASK